MDLQPTGREDVAAGAGGAAGGWKRLAKHGKKEWRLETQRGWMKGETQGEPEMAEAAVTAVA